MRIVFAGTPEYAVPTLKTLAGLRPAHEVLAVVTQPDRPKHRSKTPTPPPVKEAALRLGIPADCILQPRSINEPETLRTLRGLEPDLLCVIAYGGLLKKEALALPKLFPLNAHGSLLPKYRGAAPIQAALLAGEEATGVTIMKIELSLDSGPVLLQREIPILCTDTAGSLHEKLSALSAVCFLDALRLIEEGRAHFAPQDPALVTLAPKLHKDSGRLDWTLAAARLERMVRAMTPWPGAWTTVATPEGQAVKRIRLARAVVSREESLPGGSPGSGRVLEGDAPALQVRCGDERALHVLALQPEGGREMSVDDFLRGAGRAYAQGFRLSGPA